MYLLTSRLLSAKNSHRLLLKKLNRVTCEARFIDQMSLQFMCRRRKIKFLANFSREYGVTEKEY